MQIDTLSQINEVINSLVKKGNFKQANNLNQLFLKMAQAPAPGDPTTGSTPAAPDAASAPAGTQTAPAGPAKGAPNQSQKIDTDMMNIIKQFYVLKKWANADGRYYAYSRGNFITEDAEKKRVSAKTVGDLLAPLGVDKVEILELAGEAKASADAIVQQIKSANNWSGVDKNVSDAINQKYDLGFNFEQNKYYIGDPNSTDDVILKDSVADLESVYNSLGQYYNTSKKFPNKLSELQPGGQPEAPGAGVKPNGQPEAPGAGVKPNGQPEAPGAGVKPNGQSAAPGGPAPGQVASSGDINSAVLA
jgi:hypothetical protein